MKYLILSIITLTFLASCSNNSQKETSKMDTAMASMSAEEMANMKTDEMSNKNDAHMASMENMEMSDDHMASSNSFSGLYMHYEHLSGALASDDAKEASTAASGILEALNQVKVKDVEASKKAAVEMQLKALKKYSTEIINNQADIAKQRQAFSHLSERFYELAKNVGIGKTMYKAHCPMYNDKKGAIWLSSENKIKNPYYGSAMLSCGSVQEKLK
ncbi:DUF3347 domain-containing protein [Flavobacterium aquidurense]|uniref:DUF3347 domain-containing protein n=2 Tax=Flavobacterium TaxID=237 RepID=A0A7W7N6E5_9FLAO|nr:MULTISPECIES: DUF3347 domain-containing protein [Flavobacterium]MBB4801725.1 hypothetical protein [Flavobacterium nitrogenifigens]MBB6386683.1 hypothetical protein [Flavobacterium notoginsengisoli]